MSKALRRRRCPNFPRWSSSSRAARAGDAAAWDALVDRYLPLVTAVIRRLRLSPADADDVNQTVWLRLVEHLDGLREPRALPGWLATTARNEGLRQIRRRARDLPVDPGDRRVRHRRGRSDPGEALVEDLRSHALREAMLELPENRRELLLLLLADPPLSYDEISARLGIPRGSIGPTRARALEQLRSSRALRGWADEVAREPRRCSRCLPRLTTKGSWTSWPVPWDRWPPYPITGGEAARAAFTWRTIDEELLALTHDSLELADAAVRGDARRAHARVRERRTVAARSRSTATGSSGRCSTPARSTRSSSSPSRTARSTSPGRRRPGSSRWSSRPARSGSGCGSTARCDVRRGSCSVPGPQAG